MNLQYFNISGNIGISPECWKKIMILLFSSGKLESLKMSYCKLKDKAIDSIIDGISESIKNRGDNYHFHLKSIDLEGNDEIIGS